MLQAVNWSGKLGQLFGGQRGKILRILIIFMCALGILVGLYRARGARIEKEQLQKNKPLKHSATNLLNSASSSNWVIVGNPDADRDGGSTIATSTTNKGEQYVCSVARVAREAGWKTIIIGDKLECCRMPDCYSIHKSQFLRMSYRTASTLKTLMESGKNPTVYKEAIRNLAFLWVIHRGARHIFDAYVDEYISAQVSIPKFEEELSRQLQTLALDESLALVEERGRSRASLSRNPYSHFGRPDVRLLPGSSAGQNANYHHYNSPSLHLAHRHTPPSPMNHSSGRPLDFPSFRICEVRPPSIEKFLEIDEGWWDLRAPALVLPGDTMPPLCTRNTLFSPDVFWALPLLPDYASGDTIELESEVAQNASRIPPWYIRGLWSQSLLGDLGGSIRLTLSRVPTLQLNQDYFTGGDYEPSSQSPSFTNKTSSSKLLKRWHCRSRSTFRCLLLIAKELSKSLYVRKHDFNLIESWILDLKAIHYPEPPMLPRRRSHTNPCLGADGLHGVSFFPALEPNQELASEYYIEKRNETLKALLNEEIPNIPRSEKLTRDKRDATVDTPSSDHGSGLTSSKENSTYRDSYMPLVTDKKPYTELDDAGLTPPLENSTYYPTDWSLYKSQVTDIPSTEGRNDSQPEFMGSRKLLENTGLTPPEENSTYYPTDWNSYKSQVTDVPSTYSAEDEGRTQDSYYSHLNFRETLKELEDASSDFVHTLADHSSPYSRRVLPFMEKHAGTYGTGINDPRNTYATATRTAKQLLTQIPTKSADLSPEDFPVLKAMAENMCPGFGPLIPYQPQTTYQDILLIVVFTNQHYDLIPTLEVLYRSIFPNMLYCGHPHVSVDLFLRKYQSAEHRSFSFLPTYTRATYECVLGAMEMNYEVKGYAVITDETLMKSWNIEDLDKNKIWVSSSSSVHDSRHVPVTKTSWRNLDPRGQKLPRLLDGIINTWKLFSYILVGHDSWIMEPKGIKKRSVEDITKPAPEPEVKAPEAKVEEDILETGETSYVPAIHPSSFQWAGTGPSKQNESETIEERLPEKKNSLQQGEGDLDKSISTWDLSVSDWDSVKAAGFGRVILDENSSNETSSSSSGGDESSDDVEVGGDEDESTSQGVSDLISEEAPASSPAPSPSDDIESVILATPPTELLDNSTTGPNWSDALEAEQATDLESDSMSTTPVPESSVGVPLYHVEHVEPPTPPTWHKPEDIMVTSTEVPTEAKQNGTDETPSVSPQNTNNSHETSSESTRPKDDNKDEVKSDDKNQKVESGPTSQSQEDILERSSSTTSVQNPVAEEVKQRSSTSAPHSHSHADDAELRREMELLLDSVQDVYLNMLNVVSEYKEANESSRSHEFSSEVVTEPRSLLEDTKSHRISPREFRHIRCTLLDDGHQSDLCSTLRSYILTLGQNLGSKIELDHDTIPMYYLPSWTTKPFYSVANVLLHFGVMDELALPLLFRGLSLDLDWVSLKRSAALKVTSGSGSETPLLRASSSEEIDNSRPAHYFHPFNLHKVYSDPDKRKLFCANYLLRVFQM